MQQQMILFIASSQMTATGKLLEAANPDKRSSLHVVGQALDIGGQVLAAEATGNVKGVDAQLKVIADGIYAHLGLTPPASQSAS
jgi:hypothetical protein